jgi:hypothetical protein
MRFWRQGTLKVRPIHLESTASGELSTDPRVLLTSRKHPDVIEEVELPLPHWYLHERVTVRSDLPGLIKGGQLLAGELFREALSSGQPLVKNSVLHGLRERALVRRSGPQVRLENGIFLGGFAPRAYFHHLAERLSRLPLLQLVPEEFRGLPLLVPEETLDWHGLAALTELLAPDNKVIGLSWEREYVVRRLLWLDEIHRWTAGHPGVTTFVEPMNRFRRAVHEALNIRPRVEAGLRLFVVRGPLRRSPNEERLVDEAAEFGFVPWRPETLPFAEQVAMWSKAEAVVGDDGAAWTGLIFSPLGSVGLVLTDQAPSGWSHLSLIGGRETVLYRARSTSYGESDVDLYEFRERLMATLDRLP